jgi:hypothetical protein
MNKIDATTTRPRGSPAADCSASVYDQVTRTMIVGHLCHAADQTQHSRLMQVANAILDTMSRRKKPQRRKWSLDTDHLEPIIAELRALPEDEQNNALVRSHED